jgi:AraC family transcriptional regulator
MDQSSAVLRPDLLSPHVSSTRYIFLELNPRPGRGVTLALGGRELCNPDYRIDRKQYAYYVLEYVAEGEGSVSLDGREYPLGPGSFFITSPRTHCAMQANPERPMTKYFMSAAGRALESRLAAVNLAIGRVYRLATHGDVRNLYEELIREGSRTGERTREICALLFELLPLKVAEAVSAHARRLDLAHENFLRCRSMIDENAETLRSLEDIARMAALDPSSVCRLFRRFQGTSPYQYLLRRKMNMAAEYLMRSGGLVKEAAERVGFADPYHFSRCFKAVHGVAPRHLQRGF